MAVSKRTRYEVLKRDNHTCRYCGAKSPDAKIVIDHVLPVSLGGTDVAGNLVAACQDCNIGKGSTSPTAPTVEDVKQSDLRWAAAMKQAADLRRQEREKVIRYVAEFDSMWGYSTPGDYESSLEALYVAGLTSEMLTEAVYIATRARGVDFRFRYFCGVAWRIVGELQDAARALLDAEGTGD